MKLIVIMAWRNIHKEMERCISNDDYFEASRVYLENRWQAEPIRYRQNLARTVLFYFPYISEIREIMINEIPDTKLAKLKITFIANLIRSSPLNYPDEKNLINKSVEERLFYNTVHRAVSDLKNRIWLEDLHPEFSNRATITHLTFMPTYASSRDEKIKMMIDKFGEPCESCIQSLSKEFNIDSIPKIPNPNCLKPRCYCRYDHIPKSETTKISFSMPEEWANPPVFLVESKALYIPGIITIRIFGGKCSITRKQFLEREFKIHDRLKIVFVGEPTKHPDSRVDAECTLIYTLEDESYFQEFDIKILE